MLDYNSRKLCCFATGMLFLCQHIHVLINVNSRVPQLPAPQLQHSTPAVEVDSRHAEREKYVERLLLPARTIFLQSLLLQDVSDSASLRQRQPELQQDRHKLQVRGRFRPTLENRAGGLCLSMEEVVRPSIQVLCLNSEAVRLSTQGRYLSIAARSRDRVNRGRSSQRRRKCRL
jgi:hypothetical protein